MRGRAIAGSQSPSSPDAHLNWREVLAAFHAAYHALLTCGSLNPSRSSTVSSPPGKKIFSLTGGCPSRAATIPLVR